jgi:hypothetical protein
MWKGLSVEGAECAVARLRGCVLGARLLAQYVPRKGVVKRTRRKHVRQNVCTNDCSGLREQQHRLFRLAVPGFREQAKTPRVQSWIVNHWNAQLL